MGSGLSETFDVKQPRNVGLIGLVHGLNEFFSIALPPIIPLLVADLDITLAQAGILLTVFFAMYSVFQLPAGIISDRIGKKRILVGGLIVMAIGIFIASISQTYAMLLGAQVMAGIGGSTFHPAGMSLISDIESTETEGKAMGIFGFGGMGGIAAAPLVIGGLAAVVGWRLALAAAAILGVLGTAIFVVLFVEEDRPRKSPSTDGAGQCQSTVDNTSTTDHIRNRIGQFLESVRIPLTGGIILLLVVTVIISMQGRAVQTFTTAYLFQFTDESTTIANLGFFSMLVAGSLASLWAGNIADRFDRGLLGFGLSGITALILGLTIFVAMLGGIFDRLVFTLILIAWFFVIGVTMYAIVPIKNAMISAKAEREYSGRLFGFIQTASAVGSASGPAIFGWLGTEFGIAIAYPLIAVTSVILAICFLLLSKFG